jgi:hypothetical protein
MRLRAVVLAAASILISADVRAQGEGSAAAMAGRLTHITNARVLHVDAKTRAISIQDSRGGVHVLPTTSKVAGTLTRLEPGDLVNVQTGGGDRTGFPVAVRVDRLARADTDPAPAATPPQRAWAAPPSRRPMRHPQAPHRTEP